MVYSGTGTATSIIGGSSNVAIDSLWSTGGTQPTLVSGDTNGYLGIRGVIGGQALWTDAQDYRTTDPHYSTRYSAGNPLGAHPYVAGKGVLLYEGDIKAVAAGSVTVTTNWISGGSTRIYTLQTVSPYNMLNNVNPPAASPNVTVLTIAADNAAPHDAAITSGNVLKEDWDVSSGGWNDLGHWVDITATAVDDGKPQPPGALTYEWTMTKPNVAPLIIAGKTSALLHLTLDDIDSLGLPVSPGEVWQLSVRASDSALWSAASAPIDVFVPEPATMGLLAFGIVGALLRRRRRA
jgi:hypothetical protein